MKSFAELKKNKGSLQKLTEELGKMDTRGSFKDEREWRPTTDKAGNGYAVIRFLPAAGGEDIPWVRTFKHGFKGPGGFLIDNCPTSISQPCPVCEHNSELWNTEIEDNRKIVRGVPGQQGSKRKLEYYTNILVIEDPGNPENNGKMFLYRFGKRIFDKIKEAMHPQFPGETAIDPFDFWQGANFVMKIRKVDGYPNYDMCKFGEPSPLSDDDSELERIWNDLTPLQEFLDPTKYKSYDQLKTRLHQVFKLNQPVTQSMERSAEPPAMKERAAAPMQEEASSRPPWDDEDEDEDMSFFKNLAED